MVRPVLELAASTMDGVLHSHNDPVNEQGANDGGEA